MSNIQVLDTQALQVLSELTKIQATIKELKEKEDIAKEQIKKAMLDNGVFKFENDNVRITLSEIRERTSLDTKQLELKEPDLFDELVRDYPKVTKGSTRLTITDKKK